MRGEGMVEEYVGASDGDKNVGYVELFYTSPNIGDFAAQRMVQNVSLG